MGRRMYGEEDAGVGEDYGEEDVHALYGEEDVGVGEKMTDLYGGGGC